MRDARAFWASLSEDEQIQCAMVIFHKLRKHARDGGSYRWMLYDLFGWGDGSYGRIQCSGGLEVHNRLIEERQREVM